MTEWNTGYVTANDLKVFYRRNNPAGNKPTILLLHGFTDNSQCWSVVARDLEETYDIVIPDARGHGLTQGSVSEFSTHQLAEDAAAIIRELDLHKPFVFGHSMGALTTAVLAANYPNLVRAAVLEDPPFIKAVENPTAEQQQKILENRRKIFALHDLPQAERLAQSRIENPSWPEEELVAWSDAKGEYNREMRQNRNSLTAYPWREAVTRIQCPVLLITADTDKGAIITPEISREVPQLCPACQVIHVEGAGHCIHRERYAETMRHVFDFLSKN